MARNLTIQILVAITALSLGGAPTPTLTADQEALVTNSMARFEQQGLDLPDIKFVFHDSLFPCHGHKGLYRESTRTLEMCSLDEATMLHELAHGWANTHLSVDDMQAFVDWRGLESWNDHRHTWNRRGTEHVAETITWGLLEEPNHVKWVETLEDGSRMVTYRILTLGVTVETLRENFEAVTGSEPLFRNASEINDSMASEPISPELNRIGR